MSGVRAWLLILYWPLLNPQIVDVEARGRNRDCQDSPVQRHIRMRKSTMIAQLDSMRADSCFAQSSSHCSAPALLYPVGEPGAFVALQRALPPFASARP